ncbi:AAA family ATPase [Thiovibrio sp. JS02]
MPQPELFVFFGLIATGKSTVAQAWASSRGLAYHNSDVVRKQLAGLSPTASQRDAVDQGIYSREFSQKTYAALLSRAREDIAAGRGTVLDASYQSRAERAAVRDLARSLAIPVYFVLCVCPEEEMRRRMEKRALDPNAVSDGRWEIYLKQKERFEAPDELPGGAFFTVSTDMPVDVILGYLSSLLEANA